MRTFFRWLVTIALVLHFLAPMAYAGWKNKVASNERRAAEYISLLKAGEEPGSIKRPIMRHISHYQAKQLQKKLIRAMDDAEALARAGKHYQIKELERITNSSHERTSTYTKRKNRVIQSSNY